MAQVNYMFYMGEVGEGDLWYPPYAWGIHHGLLQQSFEHEVGLHGEDSVPRDLLAPMMEDFFMNVIFQNRIREYAFTAFGELQGDSFLVHGLPNDVAVMMASMRALNAERWRKLARNIGKDGNGSPPPSPPAPSPLPLSKPGPKIWKKVVTSYEMDKGMCSIERPVSQLIKTPRLADEDLCPFCWSLHPDFGELSGGLGKLMNDPVFRMNLSAQKAESVVELSVPKKEIQFCPATASGALDPLRFPRPKNLPSFDPDVMSGGIHLDPLRSLVKNLPSFDPDVLGDGFHLDLSSAKGTDVAMLKNLQLHKAV